MTKLNRIISLFLVVVMIVGMMPNLALSVNADNQTWYFDMNGGTAAGVTSWDIKVNMGSDISSGSFGWFVIGNYTANVVGAPVVKTVGTTQQSLAWTMAFFFTNASREGYKFKGFRDNEGNLHTISSVFNGGILPNMAAVWGVTSGYVVGDYNYLGAGEINCVNGQTLTAEWECTGEPHHYVGAVEKEATCAEEGVMRYTCDKDNCGYSYTTTIDKTTTHSKSWINDIESCTVCGTVFRKRFDVKYDANGGTSGTTTTERYVWTTSDADSTYTFTPPSTAKPTREGFSFDGWSTNKNATSGSKSITASVDLTIYAVWIPNTPSEIYTMTFNGNGGTIDGQSSKTYSIASGQTYSAAMGSFPTVYKLGYTFNGFKESVSGFVLNSGNMGNTYTVTQNSTWTAQWTNNTYTVKYDGNGATSGSTADSSHTYDVSSALTSNGFTRTDYTFNGWNTEPDGSGTSYTNGQSVTNLTAENNGEVTLYAQWASRTYTTTFKFHLNGGSATGLGETTTITYVTTSTQERLSWVDIYNYGNNKATLDKVFSVTKSGYVLDYFKYTNPSYDDGIKFKALSPGDGSSIDTSLIGTTIELTAQWITGVSVTLQGGYGCSGSKVVTKAQNETLTFGDPSEYGITGPSDAKFMGWYESYNTNTGQGSGYVTGYSGTEAKTFYAVFGYPIILDAHGGLFPNGQERITVYVCKHEPYSSKSPASSYLYAFPDWGYVSGGVPTRDGYRRPTLSGEPFYMLMYGDMTQFTPEGYDQNMTIGPDEFDANNIYYEVIDGFKTPVFYQQWEPEITYNANGGSGSMATDYAEVILDSHTVLDQYTYTVKENAFTHSTKQFSGWNTNANGSGTSYSEGQTVNNITAPTTLYAQWGTITYTVAYNGNGSTSGSMSSVSHTYGTAKALTANAFKKTGYTFNGWNTQADGKGDAYANKESVLNLTAQNGATVTLYAQWKPITYTVTYNKNNSSATGSMDVSTFTYDVEAPLSKNTFIRTGYTFKNWNTKSDGSGTAYTDEQTVINLKDTQDANQNLYARWTANNYTVVYDPNGGTGSMTPSEHVYNTAKNLTANAFTRTGYTFAGWNTKADGTGTSYTNKKSVTNLTAEANGTVTLYAQWTPITYKVAYNSNGGSGTTMSNSTFTYDVPANLSANTYTYTNKVFAGWNTSSDGSGTNYADGASVVNLSATSGATVTLYAQWTDALYTMTLDPNGGTLPSGYSTTYQVVYGTAFKDICAFPEAIKTGYYVDYWMCYDGASYIGDYTEDDWNSKTYSAPFDATMVAHYAAKQYTITLVPGEGAVCSPTSFTVTYDSTYSALPTPTRTGYTFKGWYTGENGTGTKIQNSTICQIVGDDTLYAHWEAVAGTLTFKTQGGSLLTTKYTKLTETADETYTVTLYAGDSYTDKIYESVPIPTWNTHPKRQYRFDGWSLTSDGEPFWKPNSLDNWSGSTYAGGDYTVYAQWTELDIYKLTFDPNGGTMPSDYISETNPNFQYTFYEGELLNTVFGTHNNKVNIFPKPTRDGYRFLYWELVGSNGQTSGEKWSDGWESDLAYTWKKDVTLTAIWAKEYTLTLNPNYGKFNDDSTENKTFTVIYGEKYKDVEGLDPMPNPTRTGYTFLGWGVDNGYIDNPLRYDQPDWKDDDAFKLTEDTIFYAVWQPNTYHIIFDPNGGSMPEGFTTGPYEVKYDQSVSEAVGGYPTPTLANDDYKFAGWVAYSGTAFEYTWTSGSTWNYHYVAEDTVTLVAKWVENSGFTVTFHATGDDCKQVYYNYYSLDSNNDPRWSTGSVNSTGATVNNASSVEITINKGSMYSSVLSTFPNAVLNGYVLEFWYATDTDGNELSRIYPDEWSSKPFNFEQDVDFYAYYRCDHSGELTWNYTRVYDNEETKLFVFHGNALALDNETLGNYYRHHGICGTCNRIVAFGYEVDFLARDNYRCYTSLENVNKRLLRDFYLNEDVPVQDQFTYRNCGYISNEEGPDGHSFIVDYLYDGLNPQITLHFDPVIKAAKDKSGLDCWEVDYSRYGYRYDNNNHKNIPIDLDATWTFDYKDRTFDNRLTSTHLRLIAGYGKGHKEILFNGGVGLHWTKTTDGDPCIVDSGYKYGILPINTYDYYLHVMYYIPTAKHVDSYPDSGTYYGPIGNAVSYSRADDTLYCSINWRYPDDNAYLTSKSYAENAQFTYTHDIVLYANYISAVNDDKTSDGIAQGTLATVYANNKEVSSDYNKAYFDPNENSGGTMYYMYKKNSGTWECYPLFDYNPVTDYTNALKCYPDDNPEQMNNLYGNDSTKYFQIEDDFDYTEYKDLGFDTIIAKEPKRYTYYMGDEAYYVFPTPQNTPDGQFYKAYSADPIGPNGLLFGVTKDPQIMDAYVTDKNGNSFFLDLMDNSGTVSNFRMARCESDYPVFGQFTTHTTLLSFTKDTPYENMDIPLGYNAMQKNCKVHGDIVGTVNRPYGGPGGAGHKYLPAYGYEDYNLDYGAGLRLSYPEGDGVTLFSCTITDDDDEVLETGVDMQAAYYMAWEFSVKFTSNFPEGKTATSTGLPYSLNGLEDTSVSASSLTADKSGNYTIYQFAGYWTPIEMPGRNTFTCDGYYIDRWQLFDKNGNAVTDNEGKNITVKALDKATYDKMTSTEKQQYIMNGYTAYIYAREPGAEFRAVWKRAIELTVVKGGNGASGTNGFATVEYKSVYTGEGLTLKPTETSTVMVRENTQVKLSNFLPAANNVYSYLTLNNNKAKESADRIISTEGSYNFYIIDDTALTVQFAQTGSTTGFYIDRNNKLLRNNDDPWKLYSNGPPRSNTGVADSSKLNNALYYMYKSNQSYSIKVEGSNVDAFNKTYTGLYDEVIPLVTDSSGFVGWKFNGEFVSYDAVYRHRITASGTLTAEYSGTQSVVINIDGCGTEDGRDYFSSQYTLPSNCTFNETGFIYTTLDDSEIRLDDLISGNESYYGKAVSVNKEDYGSFKLMLPSEPTYYVVAYLSYKDKDNNICIVYSDRVRN